MHKLLTDNPGEKMLLLGKPRGMSQATAQVETRRPGHQRVINNDRNIPAYLRKAGGELDTTELPSRQVSKRAVAGPGEEEFIFEEDNLDVPAFIRKNAD